MWLTKRSLGLVEIPDEEIQMVLDEERHVDGMPREDVESPKLGEELSGL